MSRGYWLYQLAARGLVVAAVIACALCGELQAQPVGESPSGQESAADIQAKPEGDRNPPTPALLGVFGRIASALEAITAKTDSPEEAQRGQADLRAQQEMAHWAFWMFVATAVQIMLGGVGIFFIWRTLRQNRQATKAAIKAAEIADRAVEITSDTAKRQLRAYVSIEASPDKRPVAHRGTLIVTLRAVNRGQTPAYGFMHWTTIGVSDYPLRERLRRTNIETPAIVRVDIGPGAELPLRIVHNGPISTGDDEGLRGQTKRFYIFGIACYRDAFKHRRYTRFRLMIPVMPNGRLPGIEIHPEGNKSN